jgi:hypothetical protein
MDMTGKRSTPEQIIAKLRQVEVLTAQGKAVAEAVRAIGVTKPTYYRWRSEYGGLKLDQVKRLRLSGRRGFRPPLSQGNPVLHLVSAWQRSPAWRRHGDDAGISVAT